MEDVAEEVPIVAFLNTSASKHTVMITISNPVLTSFTELGMISLRGDRLVRAVGAEEGRDGSWVNKGDYQYYWERMRSKQKDDSIVLIEIAHDLHRDDQ